MAVSIVRVPAGRAATDALADLVGAKKQDDRLAPVTVVVASNHAGVSMRRRLAAPAGLIGVGFVTIYRLAELLGAARLAETGRRPVSTPIIATAVRAALADEPGLFAPVAAHPATETAFVHLHRQLSEVPAAALDRLAESSRRSNEVVRLHRSIRSRLRTDWHDEADLITAAIDRLRAAPDGLVTGLGTIVVHLPRRLSPTAATLIRALGEVTEVEVIVGGFRADVDDGADRLAQQLHTACPSAPTVPAVNADLIVSTSDADDEVRYALRVVSEAVVGGTPLERIAIVYSDRATYARILNEQLTAAGIAHNGAAVRPLAETVAGRLLVGLSMLAELDWRREAVFELLSDAPVHDRGRRIDVVGWERISRDAGVVSGAAQWIERLSHHLGSLEEAERKGYSRRHDHALTKSLLAFMTDMLAAFDDTDRNRTWRGHSMRALRWFRKLTGSEADRAEWNETERAANDRVIRAVERLATLGSVEPGPIAPAIFHRTLALELDTALDRVGRFGEGVLVGPIGMVEGLELDVVVMVGLAEGLFPMRQHDDSLVPDTDRRVVGDGLLLTAAERCEDDHRAFHAAIAAADPHHGRRILTWPRGDLRGGGDTVPSRWLVDAVARRTQQFEQASTIRGPRPEPWLVEVPSFEAGLRAAHFPSSGAEYDLADLLHHSDESDDLASHRVGGFPAFVRASSLRAARQSREFTRFDGNLSTVVGDLPIWNASKPFSSTALERWASCPHAYFVDKVLGVGANENPEDRLALSPLDSGNLVHEVLEQLTKRYIETGTPPDESDLDAALTEVGGRYEAAGVTGRQLLWRRDQRNLARQLAATLARDHDRLAELRGMPVAAEFAFGMGGEPALVHTLPDGQAVSFRGSIDRVDRDAHGNLVVIDYKTGSPSRFDSLKKPDSDPVDGGRHLQLVVYGLAARAKFGTPETGVHSFYWFVSPRGQWDMRGYEIQDRELDRFNDVVSKMVASIAGGIFPAVPEEPNAWKRPWPDCVWCDPDNLGTGERFREWERIREHPQVAVLDRLSEWDNSLFVGGP